MIHAGTTIVFQGDSITDTGRDRERREANDAEALGRGYALMCAGRLLANHPGDGLKIFNRGVAGDQVTQLQARWKADCLDLKPDVLSVLIGVNDCWHGVAKGEPQNGTTLDQYERVYREILDDARAQNPKLHLVLIEPFVTETSPVTEMNFHPDLDQRRGIAREVCGEFGGLWIPAQTILDDAVAAGAGPADVCFDGVHPTPLGHGLIADAWIRAVDAAWG